MPPPVAVVAVILVVLELPDQPLGNVQAYDVAPERAGMEYVSLVPRQTLVFPVIDAGCAGGTVTFTDIDCAALVPQLLEASTVILPPAVPAVEFMVAVVELPDQPEGNVHI